MLNDAFNNMPYFPYFQRVRGRLARLLWRLVSTLRLMRSLYSHGVSQVTNTVYLLQNQAWMARKMLKMALVV
jgi:hypothetical protein